MSMKLAYILYWLTTVLAILFIVLNSNGTGASWLIIPEVFFCLAGFGMNVFMRYCFKCPNCGENLNKRGCDYILYNPWKSCPCCGRKLD